MDLLEQFGMLYLSGQLPGWWYKIWGSVTTVPLFKTEERETVRPVGIRNPLIRTLHTRVIRENRAAFNAHLEPQQLALSEAGGHKLVHQVRMVMEEHRDWVVAKVDVRNAHNEIWRSAIISALEAEPTLQHLAWFAAVVLAPSTGLETGGQLWGTQGEGKLRAIPRPQPILQQLSKGLSASLMKNFKLLVAKQDLEMTMAMAVVLQKSSFLPWPGFLKISKPSVV